FKRADKSGASYALILGEDEIANQTIAIKPLRGQGEQEVLEQNVLMDRLRQLTA
ncbi:MAG: His/Gly/Thr/Pro-type tRNA ligase C-terminal domain-containing protein, partial [Gammaproteobacteria bacterium]